MCGGPSPWRRAKVLSGHRPPFILQILLPEGGGSHNGQQHFHHMQDFLSLFDLCWQGSRSYLIFMWSVRCRLSIKWTSEVWSACSIAHGHRHSRRLSCRVDTSSHRTSCIYFSLFCSNTKHLNWSIEAFDFTYHQTIKSKIPSMNIVFLLLFSWFRDHDKGHDQHWSYMIKKLSYMSYAHT